MCSRDNSRPAATTLERPYMQQHVPESTCCHCTFTWSTVAGPRFDAGDPSSYSAGFDVGVLMSNNGLGSNNGCMVEGLAGGLEESNSFMNAAAPPSSANTLANSASSLLGGTPPWSTSAASSSDNPHHNNSSNSTPLSPHRRPCEGIPGQQTCPGREETCNALALRMLRNMHVVAEECLSGTDDGGGQEGQQQQGQPRRQAWATGAVLSQLEDGLAAAASILGCGPCSMRPQLQLLVATILEMMVQWCGAVVCSKNTTTTTAAAPDPSCRATSRGELLIDQQTVSIGDYKLDGALEVQVVAHVVLGKLQGLKGLLDRLLARMEESNMALGSKNGSSPETFSLREVGLLEIIRERVVDCLNSQIGVVRGDALRLERSSAGL